MRYKVGIVVALVTLVCSGAWAEMTVTEEAFSKDGHTGYYLRYTPAGYTGSPKLPLLVQYHGGSGGSDLSFIYSNYIPQMIASGYEFDAIVLCPQSDNWWSSGRATAFLDYAIEAYAGQINPARVYVTGESGGGLASWRVGAARGDKLAALLPCASMGGYEGGATNMLTTPIWAFHNVNDPYQPVEQTRSWVNACIAAGHTDILYTELTETAAEAGMDCHQHGWVAAWSDPAVWAWMFSQSRVTGDYTSDGVVNTADYTLWADTFGNDGSPGKEDLRADGNDDGVIDTVDYVVWADHFNDGTPVINYAPNVSAGLPMSIMLPTADVLLEGRILDDALPTGSVVTALWTQQSGPAGANIVTPTAAATQVTFTDPGVYVFRLTAGDGALSDYDEVAVTVHEDSGAPDLMVITPTGWGTAVGSGYCGAGGAFNAQPTWDAINEMPFGSDPSSYSNTATEYADRHWYVDFGPDYANLSIYQCWTRYTPWSGGTRPGFAALWWDDDNDNVNDNGIVESTLNFHNANAPHIVDQAWVLSADASTAPITPSRRYLIIATPSTAITRGNEFAFVGTITQPLSVQAGLAPAPVEVEPIPAATAPAKPQKATVAQRRARLAEIRQRLLERFRSRGR